MHFCTWRLCGCLLLSLSHLRSPHLSSPPLLFLLSFSLSLSFFILMASEYLSVSLLFYMCPSLSPVSPPGTVLYVTDSLCPLHLLQVSLAPSYPSTGPPTPCLPNIVTIAPRVAPTESKIPASLLVPGLYSLQTQSGWLIPGQSHNDQR